MEPYADLSCILKVNVDCEACKMKIVEVLSSIIGVYSVDIDAREGLAKVSGEVDPNILMQALARSGKHAELAWVKLKHPVLNRDGPYGYNCYSCSYDEPHGYSRYRRGLHGHSWYDNTYRGRHDYYPHPYCHQYRDGPFGSMPSSRYPPQMYDSNTCSIM